MAEYTQELGDISNIPKNINIAFITAEFNKDYTSKMESLSEELLEKNHFRNITKYYTPGAFEIPGMIERVIEKWSFDLIYCFGVVIRWATTHYDYVCTETARGIMNATQKYKTPIIFGILTCENKKQVLERINENLAISGLNLLSSSLKI